MILKDLNLLIWDIQNLFRQLVQNGTTIFMSTHILSIAQEIADVQIYLVRLADVLGIDIGKAVAAKMALNEQKYPVAPARVSAGEYTDFEDGG